MARMRKVARLWREDARAAAAPIMAAGRTDYFTIEPHELFGRDAPLELEIGAGRGDFIVERAAATPERNFIAVELAATVAHLMAVRAGRRGLTNLRVIRMDARPLVHLMLATGSVSACHIYFPDPWPKDRQAKHRLFTPDFARGLVRVLAPDTPLYVATDVEDYARVIFPTLEAAGFSRTAAAVPGASETGFARKFIEEGRPIYAAAFVAR
jgi:tRNA (guanine-N7-)-methyltransferase